MASLRPGAIRIALALAVAGVALAAAGAALWLSRGDSLSPTAAVHAAISKTCGDAAPSLDAAGSITYTTSGETGQTLHFELQIEGYDLSYLSRIGDETYEEFIVQDGQQYLRIGSGDWLVSTLPPIPEKDSHGACASAEQRAALSPIAQALGVDKAAEYEDRGEVLLDGVRVRHYVNVRHAGGASDPAPTPNMNLTSAPRGPVTHEELWISSDGYVAQTQARQDILLTGQRVRTTMKISGYGEPNVITAPALPAPTRMPAPTAAP